MPEISTKFYKQCIKSLKLAYSELNKSNREDDIYGVFRAACIKEFEIILEQSGKLLRKLLKSYYSSPKTAYDLTFKDIFRAAHKFNLINEKQTEKWLEYRDNRNITSHDYGEMLADKALEIIPEFISDAEILEEIFTKKFNTNET